MAATDRSLLRLGAYEILFTQTPGPVVINEAVELAKRFGTAHSAQFVNGILDKFLEGHRKERSLGTRMGIFSRSKKPAPSRSSTPATEEAVEPGIYRGGTPPRCRAFAAASGFFARFKQGLKKTTQLLNTDIRDLFKSEGRLVDDAFLDELLEILIKTDMGPRPPSKPSTEVRTQFRARVVHMAKCSTSSKRSSSS